MNKKRIKFMQGMENAYIKQLFVSCNDKDCTNAFCRVSEAQNVVVNSAEKLMRYGDLFLCENKQRLLAYKNNKYQNCQNSRKEPSIDFKNIQNEDSLLLDFVLDAIMLANKRDGIECLSPIYSEIIKKEHDGLNLFLLKNILIILLSKYDEDPWHVLGLIILRIFVTFDNYNFISNDNIIRLCNVIINIHNRLDEDLFIPDHNYNFDRENLNSLNYTIKDFIHLVNAFCCILENQREPCIRTNTHIEELLNVFTILYLFNEQMNIFPYKKFYLANFCKKHNFKEEFRFFRSDCKSILRYNFILPLEIKAEYLKYEHGDTMKNSLQDAFFRALFEGPKEPYLFLTVGRSTIYKETFNFLKRVKPADLRKQIKITFKNEEGIDSGGIRKEFFQLLSEELQDDTSLFTIKNNTLWIRSNNDMRNPENFVVLGKLIGIALYNDMILNLPFPGVFFKKLLDRDVDFEDLNEIEPEIYTSLNNLKKCTQQELNELELTFIVPFEGVDITLQSNSNEKVSLTNLDTFINLFTDYILGKSIKSEFSGIKKGFNLIIKKKSITFLQPKELEKIIVGSTFIDVDQIKAHSIINGFDDNDETVIHFWEIFDEYKYEEKKGLLQFITGNDRIPVSGAENLKMVIMKNGCDTDRLPSAQTCFNTLLLPKYRSKEKMKEKLNKAITMTKGFYLL